eukprot:gb/GEZN01006892.1/.p1 GENE.gb/GEZN01006892.1/~~gb/GEZN01006892.1/.p1  ORF type:complete len:487 (+),score=65.77 gb/GEZN01006892.1/:54-1514(+)
MPYCKHGEVVDMCEKCKAEVAPKPAADAPKPAAKMDARVTKFAKEGKLVVFVGAGTSMIPPTSLPSWHQIDVAVLNSIVTRGWTQSGHLDLAQSMAGRVKEQLENWKLPPEYFAEVLVNYIGKYYFNVLTVLDTATPNSVHHLIARLAKHGLVAAVVTTNFDRCVETAMEAQGVTARTFRSSEEFDQAQLTEVVAQTPTQRKEAKQCLVLKVHGCASRADTVVDTLSQRSVGLAENVEDCLRILLRTSHYLILGYSGADLDAAPGYLGFRGEAKRAIGWTWLTRQGFPTLPVVEKLAKLYKSNAQIDYGELPAYLTPLLELVQAKAAETAETEGTSAASPKQALLQKVSEWASLLEPVEAMVALGKLLLAIKDYSGALELMQKVPLSFAISPETKPTAVEGPLLQTWISCRQLVGEATIVGTLAHIYSVQGDTPKSLHLCEIAIHQIKFILSSEAALQGADESDSKAAEAKQAGEAVLHAVMAPGI